MPRRRSPSPRGRPRRAVLAPLRRLACAGGDGRPDHRVRLLALVRRPGAVGQRRRQRLNAKGALQWRNPAGAESNGKPLKVKPVKAIAEYKDMAKVDADVAGTAGVGVRSAFPIKHEEGKFVIYAKIDTRLGLGGEAS